MKYDIKLERAVQSLNSLFCEMSRHIPKLKGKIYQSKSNRSGEFGYYITRAIDLHMIIEKLKISSLIDLGCGAGLLLQQLRIYNPTLSLGGIENEKILVAIATEFCRDISIIRGDILKIKKEQLKEYDAIYFWRPFVDQKKMDTFIETVVSQMSSGQYLIAYSEDLRYHEFGRDLMNKYHIKKIELKIYNSMYVYKRK